MLKAIYECHGANSWDLWQSTYFRSLKNRPLCVQPTWYTYVPHEATALLVILMKLPTLVRMESVTADAKMKQATHCVTEANIFSYLFRLGTHCSGQRSPCALPTLSFSLQSDFICQIRCNQLEWIDGSYFSWIPTSWLFDLMDSKNPGVF